MYLDPFWQPRLFAQFTVYRKGKYYEREWAGVAHGLYIYTLYIFSYIARMLLPPQSLHRLEAYRGRYTRARIPSLPWDGSPIL